MKYFEEIKTLYKLNLIESGRHLIDTGSGYIKQPNHKFKPGTYYIFNDVFIFGKGSKARQIPLRDALIIGKPKLEGIII